MIDLSGPDVGAAKPVWVSECKNIRLRSTPKVGCHTQLANIPWNRQMNRALIDINIITTAAGNLTKISSVMAWASEKPPSAPGGEVLWCGVNICLLACSCQGSPACGPGQQGGQDCLGPKYLSVAPRKTNSTTCGLTVHSCWRVLKLQVGCKKVRTRRVCELLGTLISLHCCGIALPFALNPMLLWIGHRQPQYCFPSRYWSENWDPWEWLIKILKLLPSTLDLLLTL